MWHFQPRWVADSTVASAAANYSQLRGIMRHHTNAGPVTSCNPIALISSVQCTSLMRSNRWRTSCLESCSLPCSWVFCNGLGTIISGFDSNYHYNMYMVSSPKIFQTSNFELASDHLDTGRKFPKSVADSVMHRDRMKSDLKCEWLRTWPKSCEVIPGSTYVDSYSYLSKSSQWVAGGSK